MAPCIKIGAEPGGADKICPILYYFYRFYFDVHISVHCHTTRSHYGVAELHLRSGLADLGSSPTFATLFFLFHFTRKG